MTQPNDLPETPDSKSPGQLRREVGLAGAVLLGLGSIVGTGVFVSIGVAAGITGPSVLLAIGFAAFVAIANGLSSAQLAASHPVSGGTYEYGYRYLSPSLGFMAGWVFLWAKSASAATAALGFAGYLLNSITLRSEAWLTLVAFFAVAAITGVVLAGVRRSNAVNFVIVSITLLTLTLFVVGGVPIVFAEGRSNFDPFFLDGESGSNIARQVLHATAIMFVAYTGYGRIATLGEEVHDPEKTIPRAVVATLVASMIVYMAVGFVAVGAVGAERFGEATKETAAPLEVVAQEYAFPAASWILTLGAMMAMLGVLLNLILGLSRVLLAMGRRRDVPQIFAGVDGSGTAPRVAVVVTGIIVAGLAVVGSVETTWSFSAFSVLVYYAITNLAALRLPKESRRFPRWIAVVGLVACLFLAFWVKLEIWLAGLGFLALGLIWFLVARRAKRR